MKKASFGQKLKYAFDNFMSRGTGALLIGLAVLFLAAVLIVSTVIYFFPPLTSGGPEGIEGDYLRIFWSSFMRTLDSGTMGGDDLPFGYIALFATLAGIFLLSTLIGILNSAIEGKLDELRKGRSKVIENNHSIILGWSDQIYTIISELVTANAEVKRKGCIVVMGTKDKVEMEEELRDKLGKTGRTRIVCRSGSPIDLIDLEMVGLNTAKSIIILSPQDTEDPDAEVVKSILAITNGPTRKEGKFHIVAQLRNPKNVDVAKIVGKDELEIVLVGDLISRIVAQTCRQSGLSIVYQELLDVQGDAIYISESTAFVGKQYGDTLMLFEGNTVMGLAPKGQAASLNPPMDTVIKQGDRLVVIAEDETAIKMSGKTSYEIDTSAINSGVEYKTSPEKTLVIGWNWRAATVIRELDNYVAKGSSVKVVSEMEETTEAVEKVSEALENQKIEVLIADTTDRQVLDSLNVTDYDHIILICYSDNLEMQQADAKSLITLLHLRDIAEKTKKDLSIVSEMMDLKNRDLAQIAKVDDFIVSDKIISLLLTQISENKDLNAVFTDMFDPDGSEVYLKPIERYIKPGKNVNFYTVIEAAKAYGETAIGYRIESLAHTEEESFGVTVNPLKSDMIEFSAGDKLIVLAE